MKRVAVVTCVELPEPDPDQELLLDALRSAGVEAELLPWDDPTADRGAFDLCVLRSCWNYHEAPQDFLDWIDAAEEVTPVVNSAKVARWNIHKRYLRELEDAGVPIIPTAWFERGETVDLATTMAAHGWNDVVLKPAISAGSFRTKRFRSDDIDAGQAFLEELVKDGDAMVQRYMPAFENPGERALVWIDGKLTHAVVKQPRFHDQDEQVSDAVAVSDEEQAIADRALAVVDDELLYARIDIVNHDDGHFVVSEFELLEPSLFLLQHPEALERFVAAIVRKRESVA